MDWNWTQFALALATGLFGFWCGVRAERDRRRRRK
jgi:hypothetical protein